MKNNRQVRSRRNKLTARTERNRPFRGLIVLTFLMVAFPGTGPVQPSFLPRTGVLTWASTPPQVEDAYRLGSGDRISINIFQVPQYSGDFEVLVNGTGISWIYGDRLYLFKKAS